MELELHASNSFLLKWWGAAETGEKQYCVRFRTQCHALQLTFQEGSRGYTFFVSEWSSQVLVIESWASFKLLYLHFISVVCLYFKHKQTSRIKSREESYAYNQNDGFFSSWVVSIIWHGCLFHLFLFLSFIQLHQRLGNLNNIYICMVLLICRVFPFHNHYVLWTSDTAISVRKVWWVLFSCGAFGKQNCFSVTRKHHSRLPGPWAGSMRRNYPSAVSQRTSIHSHLEKRKHQNTPCISTKFLGDGMVWGLQFENQCCNSLTVCFQNWFTNL